MPAQAVYTLTVFAAAILITWLIGRSRPRKATPDAHT
jgi:hypothetical protein